MSGHQYEYEDILVEAPGDRKEGLAAFIEERRPCFSGR
jgi:hypothetical protein